MRPAFLLVLATLAVFCHSAAALACPEIWDVAEKLLYGSVEEYMEVLSPYITKSAMKEAELEFKQCVQESITNKQALAVLVPQILGKC